jgi:hypothetical protein
MNGQRILVPLDLEQDSLDRSEFGSGLAAEGPVRVRLLSIVTLNIYPVERVVQGATCPTLVLPCNRRIHPEFSLSRPALCYLN